MLMTRLGTFRVVMPPVSCEVVVVTVFDDAEKTANDAESSGGENHSTVAACDARGVVADRVPEISPR